MHFSEKHKKVAAFILGLATPFLGFVGMGSFLQANLLGPETSSIEGFNVVIDPSVVENSPTDYDVTLNFASIFDELYDENVTIDGLHIEVLFPIGVTPTNPQTVNYSNGDLFDPVQFVDLPNGQKRASITFHNLDIISDANLYDFTFEYASFEEHSLTVSGEAMTVDLEVIEIGFEIVPLGIDDLEAPEEDEDSGGGSSSGGGGGGGSPFEYDDQDYALEDGYSGYDIEIECDGTIYQIDDHPFTDLAGHYSELHVAALYNMGAVQGYPDGEYKPNQNITRAEYLKIIMEVIDCYAIEEVLVTAFPDVYMNDWFRPYITMGYFAGIVEGYSDGFFRPNHYVTRAEALKMLLYASKVNMIEGNGGVFPDVNEYDWFKDVVETGYYMKVVEGYIDGNFGPNDNLTRGQAAIMLINLDCNNDISCGGGNILDMAGAF